MKHYLQIIVILLSLPSCGSDSGSPTTPTGPSQASIWVSVDANPVTAGPSTSPTRKWNVSYTMTITETAGLGGNVDFITSQLTNLTTGMLYLPLNVGADKIVERAGTNRSNAFHTLTVPSGNNFDLEGGRRALRVFTVQFTDDRGNVIEGTAQLRVVLP